MLLKGMLAAALAAGLAVVVGFVVGGPRTVGARDAGGAAPDAANTIAMAPLSLGNPAVVATLKTRHPVGLRRTPQPAATYSRRLRVARGDTLAGMLIEADVARDAVHGAVTALGRLYDPRRIQPGQEITLTFAPGGGGKADRLEGLTLTVDFATRLTVTRSAADGFVAGESKRVLTTAPALVEGTITANLFDAATGAGLPVPVLIQVIRAYSWDVDFQRDIRPGDRFQIIYERFFDLEGRLVHNGSVLSAALTLRGTRHPIYLHTTGDGVTDYFDGRGHSARKALLRTPIDGARLSSRFGRRRHPILGYTKMHRGLDFSAPPGTPVYAAGNGTVAHAGRNGSYGKYVRIRHNSTYSTAYAHLSRYAKGMRRGRRLTQGQVIGYVGSTGRSTGPHLHYEIMRQGTKVNPMTVKMPSGRRLEGSELAAFQAARAEIDRLYAALAHETELARGDP